MSDFSEEIVWRVHGIVDDETELIPMISSEEDDDWDNVDLPGSLPILPIKNNVLFPGVVIPITLARDKAISLIQEANRGSKLVGVVAQLDQEQDEPSPEDLHDIGTLARIIKVLKMPDGSTTAIIQGKTRFKLGSVVSEEPFMQANVSYLEESPLAGDTESMAKVESIKEMSLKIIKDSPNIPSEASFAINNIDRSSFLINFVASNMNAGVEKKQEILEEDDLNRRADQVLEHLSFELKMLQMRNELNNKVRNDMDRQQREFFLHQQMRTIQDELGENPMEQEVEELKKRAKKKKWSEPVQKAFNKEMEKLLRMNSQSAEYSVQLNYLDLLLDLPWKVVSKDKFDLAKAERILNRDHYGLEKVKERILEHLAVLKLKGDMRSPIICLHGPPGVGKTSLGKSIAEALGRRYVRMSLGGIHDEAEIRGHRRTYIGAMPGRVIQNLKKAGTSNPVFVLDEIDKVSRDAHGDPSSALLEVLDPEQNGTFQDNYVELDYDLSKVMFIATANNVAGIQGPLRDRMEMIEVTGYTLEEKVEIASKHLVPKQLAEHGVKKGQISFPKATLAKLIDTYTNESGVRKLEQRIAKIIRHRAKQLAMEEDFNKSIRVSDLEGILGPSHEREKYIGNEYAGVVTGLAWTQTGGDILYIETSLTPGKGKLTITGNLGDVMKESAMIALEYIKAHAGELGLDMALFDKWNVHVHVPEGATPKDGPSAGVTMVTSMVSAFTQNKVKSRLAMTGEITLRGSVLPVGGIKEKILAAKRAGITEVVLCQANEKDVKDIPERYLEGLKFHYVKDIMEVLKLAVTKDKVSKPLHIA